MRISEQQHDLRTSYLLIVFTAIIIIIFIVLFARLLAANRLIRQKNIMMANNINDLLVYKEQLAYILEQRKAPAKHGDTHADDSATPADDDSDEGRALFVAMEQRIIGERLFTNCKFSRDDLVASFGIPRNRITKIFMRFTGKNFNKYLNDLRLDYAALQLKTNSNYSVEAIANDCGIPVRQTFYRLFSEKFGISPAEFRKLNADINDGKTAAEQDEE